MARDWRQHVLRFTVAMIAAVALIAVSVIGVVNTPEAVGNPGVGTRLSETIDYKPKLFNLLADNNRVDTGVDEIRADFVLRVAHGQVNPSNPNQCNPEVVGSGTMSQARSCGLKIRYAYNAYGSPYNSGWEATYINTLSGETGAYNWASNQGDVYTIHNILNSGDYDYLTISLTTDVNYSDNVPADTIGGSPFEKRIFAVTGTPRTSITGSFPGTSNQAQQQESDQVTDLTAGATSYLYDNVCSGSGANAKCNGPRAYIGYNALPKLWRNGGQTNWGLVTDYGFTNKHNDVTGVNFTSEPGTAPSNSFFVYWFNPALNANADCSQNTSFYFQWLGLKGGKNWEPVSDLTPTAQKVTGQNAQGYSPDGKATDNAAFNAPAPTTTGRNHPTSNNIMAMHQDANGESTTERMPAQNEDGSIDFEMAKAADGFDGYFKLVTWPITTNADGTMTGCETDGNNPLRDQPDAAKGVISTMSQTQIKDIVGKGWTVGTAFDKYSLPTVDPPVITSPAENDYVDEHPTVSGTGIAGSVVELYAEDSGKPIVSGDEDNVDTRGRYVGQATVDASGNWSIQDADNTLTSGSQRYHAWQVEQASGYELTSKFSNIRTLQFGKSAAPVVDVNAITVPHTTAGALASGATVHISGTAAPVRADERLEVYAVHGTGDPVSADIIDACTKTNMTQGQQDWSCDVDPAFFLNQVGAGETYTFRAKLVATDDSSSDWSTGVSEKIVDMTPSHFEGIAATTTSNGTVLSGKAYRLPTGTAADAGATVTATWPDGTTATTVVAADGSWSFDAPSSIHTGTASLRAVDAQGNESAEATYALNLSEPVRNLPVTGDHSRTVGLVACLVIAILATVVIGYTVIERYEDSRKVVDT